MKAEPHIAVSSKSGNGRHMHMCARDHAHSVTSVRETMGKF